MQIDWIKKSHWPLYVLLGFLGAAALCFSFVDICPLLEILLPSLQISKMAIVDLIRSLGAWGALSSIGLMVVHSFVPFPAELLTVANGMVFGPFWGVLITWIGAMLGAFASFGLTKRYGRPLVAKKVGASQLGVIDEWVQNQGTLSLLLSRLVPLISFNLINYGAGMTSVSWWTFAWTTAVGILPITIIMVTIGNDFKVLPWWAWGLILAAIVGATYLVKYLRRKRP